MRRRVLFVINSLAGGGAERVMTTLLAASQPWRDRYDLHLALLDREPRAYAAPDWVQTTELDCRGGLPRAIRGLRELVGVLAPDVVLSFLTRANVASALAVAGRNSRLVMSERVNTSSHLTSRAAKLMVRATYPRADRIIAVSTGVADDLSRNFGVRRSPLKVIANPVDHDAIARGAGQAPPFPIHSDDVVAAGRLVENKNFAMLIEAWARAGLPGRLLILGEGPLRATLEADIARRGLADRILLPGFVPNPFAVFARAGVYALPSNAEGFPNGLVEAMACGLPVVAANCASGPSEILLDRRREEVMGTAFSSAGALVPTDDAGAFAAALAQIHRDAGRQRIGEAARTLAQRYSVAETTRRYWAVLEDALTGAPGPAPAIPAARPA